jgi:hypothetical protein
MLTSASWVRRLLNDNAAYGVTILAPGDRYFEKVRFFATREISFNS